MLKLAGTRLDQIPERRSGFQQPAFAIQQCCYVAKLFREVVPLTFSAVIVLLECSLLRHILLIGDPVCNFSTLIFERVNVPLIYKLGAISPVGDRLSEKRLPVHQLLPHLTQNRLIGLLAVKAPRCQTRHLLSSESGHPGKSLIDIRSEEHTSELQSRGHLV